MQRYMLCSVVAGLAVLGWLCRTDTPAVPTTPTHEPAVVATAAQARPAPMDDGYVPTPLPPMPADRQGTDVDGSLAADGNGHLVLTPDVRQVFDYFLMSAGAETPTIIEARLFNHLHAALPPMAAAEGQTLWRKYMAMRADFAELVPNPTRTHGQNAVDALEELSAKHFSPAERDVLFGEELATARATAGAVDALEANPQMDAAQRQRAWAAVEERLPAAEREAQVQAMRLSTYAEKEKQVVQQGGSSADVQLFRKRTLGEAAAARLAQLDAAREAWRQRVEAYKNDHNRILANESLTQAERNEKIADLLAEHFTETEQMRVRALLGAN